MDGFWSSGPIVSLVTSLGANLSSTSSPASLRRDLMEPKSAVSSLTQRSLVLRMLAGKCTVPSYRASPTS